MISNEVSTAFWEQENEFWLIIEYSDESTWYIGFMDIELCCESADLVIENHVTKKLEMESVAGLLESNPSITLWDLSTGGRTTMTRRES